jgi:hypothetical protein
MNVGFQISLKKQNRKLMKKNYKAEKKTCRKHNKPFLLFNCERNRINMKIMCLVIQNYFQITKGRLTT